MGMISCQDLQRCKQPSKMGYEKRLCAASASAASIGHVPLQHTASGQHTDSGRLPEHVHVIAECTLAVAS